MQRAIFKLREIGLRSLGRLCAGKIGAVVGSGPDQNDIIGQSCSVQHLLNTWQEMGEIADAIVQLKRAVRGMPAHADAHFNLALAYEKIGEDAQATEHWAFYLKYDPNGAWADTARARLTPVNPERKSAAPIPFPKRKRR